MRYFRQALALMREEKLYSAMYIAGTALAVAFTMVMAVVYYIKLAPIYPERNRARTVYFEGMCIEADNGGRGQTGFSDQAYDEWFKNSPNIEYCSPTLLAAGTGKTLGKCHTFVVRGKDDYVDVVRNLVSADYFKIYEYDFVSGSAFTSKEVDDNEKVCVISDALAERLFGKGVDAMGKMVEMESGPEVRVVGVFRGGSQLTPDSYADIIYPLLNCVMMGSPYQGIYSIVATVKDDAHLQALKQELDDVAARTQQAHPEVLDLFSFGGDAKKKLVLTKDMDTHSMHVRAEDREPRRLIEHGDGLAAGEALCRHHLCAALRARPEPLRHRGGAHGAALGRDGRAQDLWRTPLDAPQSGGDGEPGAHHHRRHHWPHTFMACHLRPA